MSHVLDTACILLALALGYAPARAQSTQIVSVSTSGGLSDGQSLAPSISADGRHVVFWSLASNLVSGDLNGRGDLFVRDRTSGATALVTVTPSGTSGNAECGRGSISGDGRLVAFESSASDLVVGDVNASGDVFVRDLIAGSTVIVGLSSSGAQPSGGAYSPSISRDGRHVAFLSGSKLVPEDLNNEVDIYVRDLQAGVTRRVSMSAAGGDTNGGSWFPSISGDGRYIAFESIATNLVAGDTNSHKDIFVRDMVEALTRRVSVSSTNAQSNNMSLWASMAADGGHVAFLSFGAALVTGDTNQVLDVFVHDLHSRATERVSVSSTGAQAVWESGPPRLSDDGRFVVFANASSTLVAGDTNDTDDIFIHDRFTHATSRVSVSTSGVQGNATSAQCAVSGNGRSVAFASGASNFSIGDVNMAMDLFVRDLGPLESSAFCFGEPASGGCPCTNSGALGHGCANSTFPAGGVMTFAGQASTSADTITFSCASMSGSLSVYFQGTTATSLFIDDGRSCLGGSLIRIGTKPVSGGASSYPGHPTDPRVSVKGGVPFVGGTRYYQVIYRDAALGFCVSAQTNRTNAVMLAWGP